MFILTKRKYSEPFELNKVFKVTLKGVMRNISAEIPHIANF